MTTKRILITGASRGIGLEMARQYSQDGGWTVEACCRRPDGATDLARLARVAGGRLKVHPLDVTRADQIAALSRAIDGAPVDILVNNAGVYGPRHAGFTGLDERAWLDVLRVNTIAPLKVAEALLDNVAASGSRIIASITSRMGSIDDNGSGGDYPYRTSKAALNMAMKGLSIDMRGRGVTVVVLHPGWVRTDMGGPDAPLSVEQSVAGLRAVLSAVRPADSGRFINYDGAEIPW